LTQVHAVGVTLVLTRRKGGKRPSDNASHNGTAARAAVEHCPSAPVGGGICDRRHVSDSLRDA
jgi:hypothetical protein